MQSGAQDMLPQPQHHTRYLLDRQSFELPDGIQGLVDESAQVLHILGQLRLEHSILLVRLCGDSELCQELLQGLTIPFELLHHQPGWNTTCGKGWYMHGAQSACCAGCGASYRNPRVLARRHGAVVPKWLTCIMVQSIYDLTKDWLAMFSTEPQEYVSEADKLFLCYKANFRLLGPFPCTSLALALRSPPKDLGPNNRDRHLAPGTNTCAHPGVLTMRANQRSS